MDEGPSNTKRGRLSARDIEEALTAASTSDIEDISVSDEEEEYLPSSTPNSEDSEDENIVHHFLSSDSENDSVADEESEWEDLPEDPEIFAFLGQEGLQPGLAPDTSAFDIFKLLFDDVMLGQIVEVTNKRAQEAMASSNLKRRASAKMWKDTTLQELQIFLGLSIAIGQVKMPSLKNYWSKKNKLYVHPLFGQAMARERYELILRFIHFYDETTINTGDRLHKVAFLMRIVDNIQKFYSPGRELSLDEAMLLWRGRLVFRQYLPKKKHKYGIKLYELCTPDGYILNIIIYTGKGTVTAGPESTHTEEVVLRLMEKYLDKGYQLFMDNFYNSVKLSKRLVERKTHVCGTLRINRKGNPSQVLTKKLEKGEVTWQRKGKVLVEKWCDKKNVLMISTMHKHEMIEVTTRRGEKKMKPASVVDYNRFMSGIDRSDQMIAYYSSPRKSLRWYMKVFFHFLDVCLWNGNCIQNKLLKSHLPQQKKKTYLEFREEVALKMLESVGQLPQTNRATIPRQHFPEQMPKRKRCKACYQKRKRTDTWLQCDSCPGNPALCAAPCFKDWHTSSA